MWKEAGIVVSEGLWYTDAAPQLCPSPPSMIENHTQVVRKYLSLLLSLSLLLVSFKFLGARVRVRVRVRSTFCLPAPTYRMICMRIIIQSDMQAVARGKTLHAYVESWIAPLYPA